MAGDGAAPTLAPEASSSGAVRVVVRVRPLLTHDPPGPPVVSIHTPAGHPDPGSDHRETGPGRARALSFGAGGRGWTVTVGSAAPDGGADASGARSFSFDTALGPRATQGLVYEHTAGPLVPRCLDGYNATVFAYGQTGTGKTFTMGSSPGPSETADAAAGAGEARGVIPRAIEDLFSRLGGEARPGSGVSVRCSFLEIYNETLRDLLNPDADPRTLAIRETGRGAIAVAGVHEEAAVTAADALRCLERGAEVRSTAGTMMNAAASRSHSVFTLTIEQRVDADAAVGGGGGGSGGGDGAASAPGEECFVGSKFHLVDLAGSERAKRTGATGQRFRESRSINAGLLALGNVIRALTDPRNGGRSSVHVPYRQSKLTRLLQDSLGGTAHTVMVACVSPAEASFEETMCTLKYAQRAAHIRNRPVVNRDARTVQLAQMQDEIETLQMELLKMKMVRDERTGLVAVSSAGADGEYGIADLVRDDVNAKLLRQLADGGAAVGQLGGLADEIRSYREESERHETRAKESQAALDTVGAAAGELAELAHALLSDADLRTVRMDRASAQLRAVLAVLDGLVAPEAARQLPADAASAVERAARAVGDVLHRELSAPELAAARVTGDAHERLVGLKDAVDEALGNERPPLLSARPSSARPGSSSSVRPRSARPQSARPQSARPQSARPHTAGTISQQHKQRQDRKVRPGTADESRAATPARPAPSEVNAAGASGDDAGLRTVEALRDQLARREAELATVRAELDRAKVDLANDEDIFSDKIAELRDAKREAKRQAREANVLRTELETARGELETARGELETARGATSATAATATAATAAGSASDCRGAAAAPSHRDQVIAQLEDMDDVVQYAEDDSVLFGSPAPKAAGASTAGGPSRARAPRTHDVPAFNGTGTVQIPRLPLGGDTSRDEYMARPNPHVAADASVSTSYGHIYGDEDSTAVRLGISVETARDDSTAAAANAATAAAAAMGEHNVRDIATVASLRAELSALRDELDRSRAETHAARREAAELARRAVVGGSARTSGSSSSTSRSPASRGIVTARGAGHSHLGDIVDDENETGGGAYGDADALNISGDSEDITHTARPGPAPSKAVELRAREEECAALRVEVGEVTAEVRRLEALVRDKDAELERVRDAIAAATEDAATGEASGRSHPGGSSATPRPGSALASPSSAATASADIDARLDLFARQRAALTDLDADLKRREEIVRERESHLRERERLELKKLRNSQVMSRDILRLGRTIEGLEAEMEEKEREILNETAAEEARRARDDRDGGSSKANSNSGSGSGSDDDADLPVGTTATPARVRGVVLDRLYSELASLREAHAELSSERARLAETAARGDDLLSAEDRADLGELNERIDAMSAEIDYKSRAIEVRAERLRRENPEEAIQRLISRVSTVDAARALLQRFFAKLAEVKDAENDARARLADAQARAARLEAQAREAQGSAAAAERMCKRVRAETSARVSTLEREIGVLRSARGAGRPSTVGGGGGDPAAAGDPGSESERGPRGDGTARQDELWFKSEQLKVLEREIFFYKQANRELKRRVRDVLTARGDRSDRSGDARPGAEVVRVSARDVRPLSRDEIASRRSATTPLKDAGASAAGSTPR